MILKTAEPIEILDVFVIKPGETYKDRETGETKKYSKDLYECLCRFRDVNAIPNYST